MTATIVWILGLGLFGVYEAYVLIAKKKGATLSESVWTNTKKYPYIAFLAGALAGHLFWQDPSPECNLAHVPPAEISK